MIPGLPRSIPTVVYLVLLASHPSASGAAVDRPSIRDAKGQPVSLDAPRAGAIAVVFLSAECPMANAQSPIIEAIAHAFPAERFRLVGVFVDPDMTGPGLAAHAAEYHLTFPVARDPGLALARHFKAAVTPEAFVLDDSGRIRYRGRIDDAFAGRARRNAVPRTHELRDAIAAVLDGRAVDRPEVKAVGCPLPEPAPSPPNPSACREASPIGSGSGRAGEALPSSSRRSMRMIVWPGEEALVVARDNAGRHATGQPPGRETFEGNTSGRIKVRRAG